MTTQTPFHYPLKVQAEFDHEPIYIVDQDDREVACIQRSLYPAKDLELAEQFRRTIECEISGFMRIGEPVA